MPVTFEEFKKTNLAEWKAKAAADSKGKIVPELLLYKVEPGLEVSSFQNHESAIAQQIVNLTQPKVGVKAYSNDKPMLMDALTNGAQSVWLVWIEDTPIAPFFEDVYVDMIKLWIDDIDCSNNTRSALRMFMDNHGYHVTFLSDGCQYLKASYTFQQRIQQVKTKEKIETIIVEMKPDFLTQIAELRAIRYLTGDRKVHIVATLDPNISMSDDRQHLIEINYHTMAAYIGGVDAMCSFAADPTMARLILNIQHTISLESGITDVVDPMSGSYIVEALTEKLIKIS